MEAVTDVRMPPFHRYANQGEHSAVMGYAVVPDGIAIQFRGGRVILYNHDCPGRRHVSRMKVLAREGHGLGSYITRHVGHRFSAQLHEPDAGPRQSSTRQNAALR